jgi:hypothetical protein
MKAISIRQPWAWLIVRPDITDPAERAALYRAEKIKWIENRTWATSFRGPMLIHAAKGMTNEEYERAAEFALDCGVAVPAKSELQRGGIIGMATITDCVSESDSSWFFGPQGFLLRDARPLQFTEFRGALGFFDVPLSAVREVESGSDEL